MKTSEVQRLRNNANIQNTQRLVKSQTRSSRVISGPSQPVMMNKIEPAVFDVAFIKNIWKRFIKSFKK